MGQSVKISPSAIIYRAKKSIHRSVQVGESSIIGKNATYLKKRQEVEIKKGVVIGSHVIIYEGAKIGSGTQVEDFCRIGEKTKIGKNCRVIYGAKIFGDVTIGDNCIIGGFICEDVSIGNNCRIFGELVHNHKIHPETFHDIKKWDK